MADFTTKKGATFPKLALRLKTKPTLAQPNGVTATLTGATVELFMWLKSTQAIKVNAGGMTILSATPPADENDPNVEYPWVAGDVDTKGVYQGHVKVVYSGGGIEYFPDHGFLTIEIGDGPS